MKNIIVFLVMLFVSTAFGQQSTEQRKSSRAFHTVLRGDCDTDLAAAVFQRALESAAQAGRIAVIELAPARIGNPIFELMLDAARSRKCTLVLMIVGRQTTDAKLISLMKAADGAIVAEDTVFTLKRPDHAEIDDTESVLIARRRLMEAGTPEQLATILTFGTQHAWMESTGEITLNAAQAPADAIVLMDESGVRIEATSLHTLGINAKHDLKAVWKSLGKSSVRMDDPERIIVGAAEIASNIDRRLVDVKSALLRMESLLDLPDPAKREVALTKYSIAADNALQIAEGVERALDDVEAQLRSAPQALAFPPADEPLIESAKESYAGAWKSRIKSRRTTLDRLKVRAREFESADR